MLILSVGYVSEPARRIRQRFLNRESYRILSDDYILSDPIRSDPTRCDRAQYRIHRSGHHIVRFLLFKRI
jgi:hypothetical protein